MDDKILLVEGGADLDFFEALLRRLNMLDEVAIRPPKKLGLRTNTVSHFSNLIDLIIKQYRQAFIVTLALWPTLIAQTAGAVLRIAGTR